MYARVDIMLSFAYEQQISLALTHSVLHFQQCLYLSLSLALPRWPVKWQRAKITRRNETQIHEKYGSLSVENCNRILNDTPSTICRWERERVRKKTATVFFPRCFSSLYDSSAIFKVIVCARICACVYERLCMCVRVYEKEAHKLTYVEKNKHFCMNF